MGKTAEKKAGLFLTSYEIGTHAPGAPLFTINFSVYTPEESLGGVGHITQATNPPLNIGTMLHGQYSYMCVMPKSCHILITATGYPIIKWPQGGGVGPVIPPNVELRMVVTDDWKTGTADYRYLDSAGAWHEVKGVPAKLVTGTAIA